MGLRAARLVSHGVPGSAATGRMVACARQARLLGISPSERDPVRIISTAQIQLRRLRRSPPAGSHRLMDVADRMRLARLVMEARDALVRRTLVLADPAAMLPGPGDRRTV